MLYGGPTHLKVIAEWEMETKANVFGVVPEIIPDPHDSVMELRQLYQQPLQCSLSDCLHIYTKEETVSVESIKSYTRLAVRYYGQCHFTSAIG